MPGIKGIQSGRPQKAATRKNTKMGRDLWFEGYLEDKLGYPSRINLGGSFHPSSLGNPCDRFLFLHFNGLLPGQDVPSKLQRIFDHGNTTQTRYEKYFQQLSLYIDREIPAAIESPPIHGRADILLRLPDTSQYLVEVKTINDRGFAELRSPKEEHRIQLQIYLNILDIEVGGILYENKNNQEIKIFRQEKDSKLWESIIKRCNNVMNMRLLPSLGSVAGIHDNRYCDCLGVVDG